MYKITIEHLEKIKKSLVKSTNFLESLPATCEQFEKENRDKIISENKKTIQLIDNDYLNIK